MELTNALSLSAGAALEALAQMPAHMGITPGVMYFLEQKPKALYMRDFVPSENSDKACGAIFTIKNDEGSLVSLSYAFFKLSGTF